MSQRKGPSKDTTRRKIIKTAVSAAAGLTTNIIIAKNSGSSGSGSGSAGGSGSSADSPLKVNADSCRNVIQNQAVPRWVDALPLPQWLPPMSTGTVPAAYGSRVGQVLHGVAPEWSSHPADWDKMPVQYYQMNMRQGRQQFLPSTMGLWTDFWGYAGRNADGSFRPASAPGPQFRFRCGQPALVRAGNDLPEEMSVHMHGGHWPAHSDGHPNFVILPNAARDYYYPNVVPRDSSGNFDFADSVSSMWYHDHAIHFTAQHVARGLSGTCSGFDDLELNLIRGGVLPGIRGVSDVGPEYRNPYDIPLVFQDRLFDPNGNICYDGNDHNGYLGNVLLCNAKAYPYLKVERRKYRFRVLVGSNSRFWRFRMSDNSTFLRIGKDAWLFPQAQQTQCFLAGPATRADIIVDFSKYKAGQEVFLENILQQEDPRGADGKLEDSNGTTVSGTPDFHHRALKFIVQERDARYPDATITPSSFLRPHTPLLASEVVARRRFKFERKNGAWAINGTFYDEAVANTTPKLGTTEEWTLENGGGGWWHPIHIHLECHQQIADLRTGKAIPYHDKFKSDTTILGPNSEIKILMKFRTFKGPFVFHCHNVEHEDLDMMFQFDPRLATTASPQRVQQFFP